MAEHTFVAKSNNKNWFETVPIYATFLTRSVPRTDYSRRPEKSPTFSEISVFSHFHVNPTLCAQVCMWSCVSLFLGAPVRAGTKTYRAYTVEGGEHAETSTFCSTHLNLRKTTSEKFRFRIPGSGTTTYSWEDVPQKPISLDSTASI
jgi:hypothetical protein